VTPLKSFTSTTPPPFPCTPPPPPPCTPDYPPRAPARPTGLPLICSSMLVQLLISPLHQSFSDGMMVCPFQVYLFPSVYPGSLDTRLRPFCTNVSRSYWLGFHVFSLTFRLWYSLFSFRPFFEYIFFSPSLPVQTPGSRFLLGFSVVLWTLSESPPGSRRFRLLKVPSIFFLFAFSPRSPGLLRFVLFPNKSITVPACHHSLIVMARHYMV